MIDVMPTKLSNLNFFIFQDHDSSISLPLRDGGILQCHVRVGAPSLFGVMATSDLASTFLRPRAGSALGSNGNWRSAKSDKRQLGLRITADCQGRTIFVADAHRDYNPRFVVRADEKLTAFCRT
jgi:hypothetical protein